MPPVVVRLARLLKFGVLAGLVIALVRAVRGRPAPETTGAASWQPLREPDAPERRDGPVHFAPAPRWVDPVDGGCPTTHPIKGNADSGIFHVPGGTFYDRTVPERCYATAADAEADGFRPAKR